MTPQARDELLSAVRLYGRLCWRHGTESTDARAAYAIIRDELLGPPPEILAAKYAAGESLQSIARQTGLSYGYVRDTLIRSGVTMRPQGRRPGTRYPRKGTTS